MTFDPGPLAEASVVPDGDAWTLIFIKDLRHRLTLRHTIAKPETGARNAAGWHLCLAVLARLLDGDPVGVIRGRASMAYGWERLRAQYADMFNPDGFTVE